MRRIDELAAIIFIVLYFVAITIENMTVQDLQIDTSDKNKGISS